MQSFVHPMPRMSFLATGAIGQIPAPLRTLLRSKPSSMSLWSAVSTDRAAICTQPATLAVGAIKSVRAVGSIPHRSAT